MTSDKPTTRIYRLYWRYHDPCKEEEPSVKDAISSLQWGEENGDIEGIAVVDCENKVIYLSDLCVEMLDKKPKDFMKEIEEDFEIKLEGFEIKTYPTYREWYNKILNKSKTGLRGHDER